MLVNKEDEEIERVIANWDNALTKALHSFPFSNGEPLEFEKKRREKYYKKALKVEADMRKANCPYWTTTPQIKKANCNLQKGSTPMDYFFGF